MVADQTIEQRMRSRLADLTRSERQAATYMLSHFPMSALGSITSLARAADVSSPTIMRLVQKLGFRGYSDYQATLRQEVERLLIAPLSQPDVMREPAAHPMQDYLTQVMGNLAASLAQISEQDFTGAAGLLADQSRKVLVMGGRLTHGHASYMATLLQVIRPNVSYLSDQLTDWQQALLDLQVGDVVVIFDIRRYEANAIQFAEVAREAGAEVVLITDRWLSPAAAYARFCLPCHIEMPAAWDSTAALLVVVEALTAHVQGHLAQDVQNRLNRLEELFARTRVFRAPKLASGSSPAS